MNHQKSLEVLEEIRRDIAEAEQNLAVLRQLESYLLTKTSLNGANVQPETSAKPPATIEEEVPAPGSLAGVSQSKAIETVLREVGHPMRTMSILKAMIARGFPDPHSTKARQNLANSLFSVMRRKPDRFKKTGKGLWGLIEWGERELARSEEERDENPESE